MPTTPEGDESSGLTAAQIAIMEEGNPIEGLSGYTYQGSQASSEVAAAAPPAAQSAPTEAAPPTASAPPQA